MLADETKSGYCAFMECLLLQQFSATFMRLDSMEYKVEGSGDLRPCANFAENYR
jgi:hypothetical protein